MATQSFGIVGLEVMGRNIALNIEEKGFPIAVYNRTTSKAEEFVADNPGKNIKMGATPQEFIALLTRPRKILLMVKAGFATDATIDALKPFLEPGDILIDGGNALYTDTERRENTLRPTGLKFFGMGVSGGEEGARHGPSMMPGGDRESYEALKPILEKIAAKAPSDG
ncbi:MAG TPA: NAD(P)-binding domain-containing protein, partial [Tepidisphaeraceae bacterium]|nr:NAD(P)-binding domain-containing protein [Tepidisphaeraceae bacterium]